MTSIGSSAVQVTLSGRELALQRRQAMALRGKAGVVRSAAAQSAVAAVPRPAMAMARSTPRTAVAAVERSAAVMAPTTSAARQRRQALSQSGKSALGVQAAATRPARTRAPVALPQQALAADCGCGCKGAGCATASGPLESSVVQPAFSGAHAPYAPAMDTGSTRALARARRVALATDGKKAMLRVAQATRLAAVLPQQDWQQAIEKGASGREVAKQRRLVRALVGREDTGSAAPRPNGRMRAKNETTAAPPKVAIGHTLSGQSVTGTPVDSSRKVTGNEAGACKSITGTEYLSLEQFSSVCGTRPAPGPAKVAVSSTA